MNLDCGVQRRIRMNKKDRMVQILTFGSKLIAERGFWGVTLRDVALECGLTEAGVLHYVGSKEGLLVAVLEHRDVLDITALAERLNLDIKALETEPFPIGLYPLCMALMERNATQPEIVRLYTVLQGESLASSHPAHRYFQQREIWAMNLFIKAAQADGLFGTEALHTAREILSAMDGLQLRWLHTPHDINLVDEWDAMCKRLLTGRINL